MFSACGLCIRSLLAICSSRNFDCGSNFIRALFNVSLNSLSPGSIKKELLIRHALLSVKLRLFFCPIAAVLFAEISLKKLTRCLATCSRAWTLLEYMSSSPRTTCILGNLVHCPDTCRSPLTLQLTSSWDSCDTSGVMFVGPDMSGKANELSCGTYNLCLP